MTPTPSLSRVTRQQIAHRWLRRAEEQLAVAKANGNPRAIQAATDSLADVRKAIQESES